MISFFNKIGNSWVARVIFAVLGLSMMAFWGIGGISNTSNSDTAAMQVGNQKISMAELNDTFEAERRQIGQLTGQYISQKQAIEMGLLQKAIQTKLAETLKKMIQEEFGLAASDPAVQAYVERHPVFKDSLGKFDRNLFLAYLSQRNLTEPQLAEQLRDELANQHLSNTIRFAAPTSKLLAEMSWTYQHQERDVEALLIETDKIPLATQPTEEDLKDYYEAYLSDFMVPETRDLDMLFLSPAQLSKNIQISESELQEAYEAQKANFEIPERRHVYQIRFNTMESAQEAKKDLTASNFVKKATEAGQTEATTDFGVISRNEMLPELAEIAFTANKDQILGPIETEMGWHVLLVTEVLPSVQPNKAKVYEELKEKMAAELAYDKLNETAKKLEDLLGEGLSLKETAKRLGLSIQSFEKVTMDAENLPAALKNKELMQDVFTLKEGEASALIEQANGYLVAQVQKISPTQAKNFTDVKQDLKQFWRTEQQKNMLQGVAQEAIEQVKIGSIPASKGQLMIVKQVTLSNSKDLPAEALQNIFTQGTGYKNATLTMLSNGALITVVKNTRSPVMPSADLPTQMEQLSEGNSQLLYDGVVASFANDLNVKINTSTIQKAFAVYQND